MLALWGQSQAHLHSPAACTKRKRSVVSLLCGWMCKDPCHNLHLCVCHVASFLKIRLVHAEAALQTHPLHSCPARWQPGPWRPAA